ncbi:LysR family transcriptional regulator [Pseudomonas argentinensis]|uniref:LysR family transcriptional regulator n=1 Tax=Phytopseudomonas argentinensis TaxID=289370 RepID=UPI0008AA31C9|nr:LysR substrate-binding domain-containing protein [Pseudomonas argentinensis]
MQRPTYDHRSSRKPAPTSSLLAANLADLYWLVHVVQAGSFSAAALGTGMAKSNLSRRIIQLEKRMEVQLLIRKPRALHLTPIGSRIYSHALKLLHAAEAVDEIAKQATGLPRGPLHLSAPGILAPWLYGCLRTFREAYPDVALHMTEADELTDLAGNHLDTSLSFCDVPGNSDDVVSRPLAELEMVIVGAPELVERLGNPTPLLEVEGRDLLVSAPPARVQHRVSMAGERALESAALYASSYQAALNSARAGLGLATLPLHACLADLQAGRLRRACAAERPPSKKLYALMNPHRSITPAARALVSHLRHSLMNETITGISALDDDVATYQ